MKIGKSCRKLGEDLEETSATLSDYAELAELLDWPQQAAELRSLVSKLESMGRQIRGGSVELATVPAFPQRNM